jgi:hypothetical protein
MRAFIVIEHLTRYEIRRWPVKPMSEHFVPDLPRGGLWMASRSCLLQSGCRGHLRRSVVN